MPSGYRQEFCRNLLLVAVPWTLRHETCKSMSSIPVSPDNERALRDTGRAAAGALLFSLPLLMTMELWYIAVYIERWKLLLFLSSSFPLLIVLSRLIGFEKTSGWSDAIKDCLVAVGISFTTCFAILFLLGVLSSDLNLDSLIGAVAVQLVPASIGALLARSQLGVEKEEDRERQESYSRELFLMAIGALFLTFNLAPTEETLLISFKITYLHTLAIVVVSLLIMHGFVFSLGFAGGSELTEELTTPRAFLYFTLPGYLISALLSFYLLWIFGSLDGLAPGPISKAVVVQALPASIGAAAARLIL